MAYTNDLKTKFDDLVKKQKENKLVVDANSTGLLALTEIVSTNKTNSSAIIEKPFPASNSKDNQIVEYDKDGNKIFINTPTGGGTTNVLADPIWVNMKSKWNRAGNFIVPINAADKIPANCSQIYLKYKDGTVNSTGTAAYIPGVVTQQINNEFETGAGGFCVIHSDIQIELRTKHGDTYADLNYTSLEALYFEIPNETPIPNLKNTGTVVRDATDTTERTEIVDNELKVHLKPAGGSSDASQWSKSPALQDVDIANNTIINTAIIQAPNGINKPIRIQSGQNSGITLSFIECLHDRINILDGKGSQNDKVEIKEFIKAQANPSYVAPAFGGVLTNKFLGNSSAYALNEDEFYKVFTNAVIPNDPSTTAIYNSIINHVIFAKVFGFNSEIADGANNFVLNNNNKIYLQFQYTTTTSPVPVQVKLEADTVSFIGGSISGTRAMFKWDGSLNWAAQANNLPIPVGETTDYYFILWLPQNSERGQISMFEWTTPILKPTDPKGWQAQKFVDVFATFVFRVAFVITADNIK